jgi:ferredoxin
MCGYTSITPGRPGNLAVAAGASRLVGRQETAVTDGGAGGSSADQDVLEVWIDQQLCTGDGLCVQYAPEVFEFDVDGLAYVKDADGELKQSEGARVDVPANLRLDVLDSAKECPGNCIHVARAADGVPVAGPAA